MATSDYIVGEKVVITKTLEDGGNDVYPPFICARKGQIVTILEIHDRYLLVNHHSDLNYKFKIYEGEYAPTFLQIEKEWSWKLNDDY